MNEETKTKWLEALRSGEYKQGRGVLRDGGSYCCLGVLCDVIARDPSNDIEWGMHKSYFAIGRHYEILPDRVVRMSGLLDSDPDIEYDGYDGYCLSGLNDDQGLPFSEIADLIEAQL